MKRNWRRFIGLLALFVVLAGGAIGLQGELIRQWRALPYQFRDNLQLPESGYARLFSLGYDNWVADFLWLRMIQTFAAGYTTPSIAPQLMGYFELISDLDPYFLPVYSFAILGVGEELNRPEMVARIVDKGVTRVPAEYRIPYEGAFYAFWRRHNAEDAKYYTRLARFDPDYPNFLDRWEGYFDLQSGRYRAAYEKYLRDFVASVVEGGDWRIAEIQLGHLRRAVDEWFRSEIRTRALAWYDEHGEYPTMEQLRAAGAFEGVVLPNWQGIEFAIIRPLQAGAYEDPTNVAMFMPSAITTIAQNMIREWDDLPPGPYDIVTEGRYPGFVIWPGATPNDEFFIISQAEAIQRVGQALDHLNSGARSWATEHDMVYPSSLEEFAPSFAHTPDPWGDPWVYNPETGRTSTVRYGDLSEMVIPEGL